MLATHDARVASQLPARRDRCARGAGDEAGRASPGRTCGRKPLAALLNLLLLTLGFAAISLVLLVSEQLEEGMRRDLAGIDLVVGAKGSPMQLILAGVFHLDVPPGNIPLAAVAQLKRAPAGRARRCPISLGDTLRGYRIVGTTPDYAALYGAQLAEGAYGANRSKPCSARRRDATGLKTGDSFVGAHGLGAQRRCCTATRRTRSSASTNAPAACSTASC